MPLLRMLLVLLLALPHLAWAQTGVVRGTVTDAAGEVLPGVHVFVEGTTLGAVSSRAGSFLLARVPAGPQVIVASAVGFERTAATVTVAAGDTVTTRLVLREAVLRSDEVVVTASRREQALGDVPVSLSIIPPEDLTRHAVVSLDDALRYVPGVQMADNQINVRGSSGFSYNTGSRVLLLVDGMPLLRPDSEGVPFDTLPLDQIERIEVIKGPSSALYGGNALGGVINVITKAVPETPETTVRLQGGAYEPVRYASWRQGWTGADTPRWFGGGTVTHARRFSDRLGMWTTLSYRADAGYLHQQQERDLDLYAKVGWRPSGTTRFDVLTGWTRRESDAFLYWNGLSDPLNPGTLGFVDTGSGTPAGSNDNLTDTITLLPTLTHIVSPALFVTLKGRIYGAAIRPIDERGRPRSVDDGTLGVRYGGEVQVDWMPTSEGYATLGLAADALATESSFFQEEDAHQTVRRQPEGAVFAQWEQSLGERLALTGGLRYDVYYIEATDAARKLSPKLSAALEVSPQTTLRAAFGQGFRVPSLAERFVSNSSFLPLIQNLDLRPEESTGYEMGLRSTQDLPSVAHLSFDVALFWTNYHRLVEPTFMPDERAFQFVNLTRARIRGLEVTADVQHRDGAWRLQAGYTLLDADDLTTGEALLFRSRHLLKASASVVPLPFLSAGLDLRLASAFERVDTDFARFVPDADVTLPIRVLDAQVGVHRGSYRLTVLVDNLLEYYYVERPAILAPPRHATLQFIARF